jgi:hypothetical protein
MRKKILLVGAAVLAMVLISVRKKILLVSVREKNAANRCPKNQTKKLLVADSAADPKEQRRNWRVALFI